MVSLITAGHPALVTFGDVRTKSYVRCSYASCIRCICPSLDISFVV
jgi:hypothetical protein